MKNLLPEPHPKDITITYDEIFGSIVVTALSFALSFLYSYQ